MIPSRDLAARFEAYGDWRRRLSAGISSLHEWLPQQDLADAQVDVKVQQLLERLQQDKLVVAFVAEFSRGKSELINAIFFADFGQRLLPSSAGRTTMCPTELLLRPVAAAVDPPAADRNAAQRRDGHRIQELRRRMGRRFRSISPPPSGWPKRSRACRRSSACPIALARKYGLFSDGDDDILAALERGDEGSVEIPCWRHAMINFPHPLLQQGLVILDTPGLNAIGTEPELTLNLLPNAHAVLFLLAADAGVTKTDLDVWNEHLAGDDPATKAGAPRHPEQDRRPVGRASGRSRDRRRDRPPGATRAPRCSAFRRRRCSRCRRRRRCWPRSTATTRCSREAACRCSSIRCRASSSPPSATSSARRRRARCAALAASIRDDPRRARVGHRRAARRADRAARQEPGRRRAHDGARQGGEGAVRARARALHGAAHGVHAAHERPLRRDRALGAARTTPRARAGASRTARSRRACATRWASSSRACAATSTRPAARPRRSTT